MAKEIERKFLVVGDAWRHEAAPSRHLRQAYLASTPTASVRVRIVDDSHAVITIKSANPGRVRDEFEYSVPVADAEAMLALRVGETIDKRRYELPSADGELTVDEFLGANADLVVAEIELAAEDLEPALPAWIGREITDDRRFYNASLAERPFGAWPEEERHATLGQGSS